MNVRSSDRRKREKEKERMEKRTIESQKKWKLEIREALKNMKENKKQPQDLKDLSDGYSDFFCA